MSTPTIPVAGAVGTAITNTGVNKTWGLYGAGPPRFWEIFGNKIIYRDSGAKMAPPCVLQNKDATYLLMSNTGMDILFKGRFQKASTAEETGDILVGPVTARRVESKRQPIELRDDEDPAGLVRQVIMSTLGKWGDLLPLRFFARMLVNGRTNPDDPVRTCYDGQPLISLNHVVNPLGKGAAASAVKPNLIQLPGAVDESAVAKVFDTLRRYPDLDGVSLPNADGDIRPLIVVPNETLAMQWAHILGGPNASKDLFQQGQNAAVSSVNVGRADLMVWPWLVTEAESGLSFDPEKRSYVFSRTGRGVAIYREPNPPVIRNTGPQGQPAHDKAADEIYIRAFVEMAPAEYRGVVAVDQG